MSPVEALKIALNKEETSIRLYNNMANKHPDIKELLLFLLTEEQKHKQLIEKKIFELTKI